MSTLSRLVAVETKLFLRDPTTVFFALAFAPILLVVLGSVPSMREPHADLGGVRLIELYVPITVASGLGLFALNGLSQLFAAYRERGVLRRMRTTPVRPSTLIGAQLLMAVAMAEVTMLVMVGVGRLAFDVALPGAPVAFIVAHLLVSVAMFAVGLLVAALAPTAKSASAIGAVLFFPLAFFGGLWLPRAGMGGVLRTISDLTPLGAGVQSLQDATAGHWPALPHVAVLLGWTLVAGAAAARYFRWE